VLVCGCGANTENTMNFNFLMQGERDDDACVVMRANEHPHFDCMPLIGTKRLKRIPIGIFTDHRAQAAINHGASLVRLAQRGGVDVREALAILTDKRMLLDTDPDQCEQALIDLLAASAK
jgi:hypothetical protein